MAAGHQKKRWNASNVVSCTLQEQHRTKKRRVLESHRTVLNMRPHAYLEWDETQKQAVAKREQIGITLRDMAPFVDNISRPHQGLADVFCIPQGVFELANLDGVLSYEVWETILSESDRELLIQFLPRGVDVEQVLKPLLGGENLHFGNPFVEWSALLCSENLHPDAVIHRNHCLRASRKAYYSELQNYHEDILESLQKWKRWWMTSKDPEKDIIERFWRCSGNSADNTSSEMKESGHGDTEENLSVTADSGSWIADEIIHSSNNVVSACNGGGKLLKRCGVGKMNGNLVVVRKREKLDSNCKDGIYPDAAAKKIPYSKVTKKKQKQANRMKQSGDCLQSKSLKCPMDDIKSFNAWQDGLFGEEHRKKLHDHWLQLVNKDIPVAFEHYRERRTQRYTWRMSLDMELADKLYLPDEDDNEAISDFRPQEQVENGESVKTEAKTSGDEPIEEEIESVSPSSHNSEQLKRIPSLNSCHDLPVVVQSEASIQEIVREEAAALNRSSFIENMNSSHDDIEPEVSVASAKNIWSSASMSESYYHIPSASHGHTSCSELLVNRAKPNNESARCLMDMESGMLNQEAGDSLVPASYGEVCGSGLNMENGGSLLCQYSNQDQNGLLPSFLKGNRTSQSFVTHHLDSRTQPGLQYIPSNTDFSGIGQYSHHFQAQQHERFEQQLMHEKEKEMYTQQMLQKTLFPSGQQARKDIFPSVSMPNWAPDSMRVTQLPSHFDGSYVHGQDWFPESRVRNWPSAEASGSIQCVGGVPADGSLYGVMSQCSQIEPRHSFGSTLSEPYIPGRNFTGVGLSRNGDIYPSAHHQANFLGRHDATPMKMNTSLMNLPHPSSSLPDSVGRPFLRSWNQ